MTPNDRPDWSTPGTASATVQSYAEVVVMGTTRSTETFTLVMVAATQQLELHRLLLQYRTTATTANITLEPGGGSPILVWFPRKASTPYGSRLQFDFEGVLLPKGAPLQVKVITNFTHGVQLQVTINYVVR